MHCNMSSARYTEVSGNGRKEYQYPLTIYCINMMIYPGIGNNGCRFGSGIFSCKLHNRFCRYACNTLCPFRGIALRINKLLYSKPHNILAVAEVICPGNRVVTETVRL